MKKMIKVIMIFSMLLALCSCSKKIKIYDAADGDKFLESIDKLSKSMEHDYGLIDLRDFEMDYTKGHFFGFNSYDLENGNMDELKKYIESIYHKEKMLFIIDKNGDKVESVAKELKKIGYKRINIYLGGYEKLNSFNYNEKYFRVVTGKEGCNC